MDCTRRTAHWIVLGVIGCQVALLARGVDAAAPRVDFGYAFAPPHRITIGRPDSSDRTLLDLQPGSLRMAWSYDNLTHYPLAAFKTPPTSWDLRITPQIDGAAVARSRWTRLDEFLPALLNTYDDSRARFRIEAIGGMTGAVLRVTVTNRDTRPHQLLLRCDAASWGENPAWIDPANCRGDNLVAGWNERADRVLVLGLGAETYSLQADGRAPGPKTMVLVWALKPGESRVGWIVRPYRAYAADLPELRRHDWSKEVETAQQEWHALLDRAARFQVPDLGVVNSFRACLADLFIMREPVAGGAIAGVPGTEVYRAANSFEAGIVAIALDQMGLHDEAEKGYRACLEMQEPDGNWDDPRGWGHLMWGGAGFKAWTAMEHYRLTADRGFLERVYPRLAASSRWQERQRSRTRTRQGAVRPLTYGLMPRGMGDCGLMDDGDLYGVFLPHNIWAVYADRLALEAAEILGQTGDRDELRSIYETGRADLLTALDRGAIREAGYRWIPGVAGKTSGSRWGALNALFPCRLLPPDHELISGTIRKIESTMSPGGIPIHTGWLADGMWVAITLDNLAEAHLARHNGDAAARYLHATLNHATPLVTWCEERGPEPGATKCTGDRQHLWTPVAVVRCLRDCLVMEEGDSLELALGSARHWLAEGRPIQVDQAATPFGPVSYRLQRDKGTSAVSGVLTVAEDPRFRRCAAVNLHVRLPDGQRLRSVNADSGASVSSDRQSLQWKAPRGTHTFRAVIGN